jgi:hypothetical protein
MYVGTYPVQLLAPTSSQFGMQTSIAMHTAQSTPHIAQSDEREPVSITCTRCFSGLFMGADDVRTRTYSYEVAAISIKVSTGV